MNGRAETSRLEVRSRLRLLLPAAVTTKRLCRRGNPACSSSPVEIAARGALRAAVRRKKAIPISSSFELRKLMLVGVVWCAVGSLQMFNESETTMTQTPHERSSIARYRNRRSCGDSESLNSDKTAGREAAGIQAIGQENSAQ